MPVILLIGVAISYNSLFFDVYFNRDMLDNVLQTTPAETMRMFSPSYIAWLFFLGIVPVFLYLRTKIIYRTWWKELLSREDAYPRERGAQLELARQKMQQAIAAGDVAAQTRLNEWLANGTLPEKAAEKRFEHIQYWISDYFAQKGVNLHAILQDIESPDDEDDVTFHENAAYSAHLADDDDVAEPAAWEKWAKWALAMVLIYGIKTCALNYQRSRQQPENAVSGSLQTQSAPKITPTAEPADTATPKTAQAVGNQAVSAEDAVFILQQKLPLTLFTGYHEIRGARLEQGNIWLDLHDKNRGMMSIQAARGLYCREQAFDGIRASGAPVNFAVTAAENVQYEIADLSCQ